MEAIHFSAVIPFVILLVLIAVLPLTGSHWWEHNFNKFITSAVLSIPVVIYLLMIGHGTELFNHVFLDYIPFIILLGALFIVSGGIYISANVVGKPCVNLIFLALGAILASIMGTTGASMLLIRPLLRANEKRSHQVHTVMFFLAIVANTGGLLTPLGDPALFILYLRGVPFQWFAQLAPEWLFVNGLLLMIFYAVDRYYYLKQYPIAALRCGIKGFPIRIRGSLNMIWIIGIVLAVALVNDHNIPQIKENPLLGYLRELIIVIMAILSMLTTSKGNFKRNVFSWGPILEVAALFLGIFITMIPAVMYLDEHAAVLGIKTTAGFYFGTGFLSSVLDNTPTAAAFHSLAASLAAQTPGFVGEMVSGVSHQFLRAISLGAVLFGAMTYIGNGPNFLVKSIAENRGIKMPGFMGYIFSFSFTVLLPVYIIVYLVFL